MKKSNLLATLPALILAVLIPLLQGSQKEVELGIRTTYARQIPLALAPFEVLDGASPSDASTLELLVFSDLEFSGLFDITRGTSGMVAGEDAASVVEVRGTLSRGDGETYFEGRLIDAASNRTIGGKRYLIKDNMIRRIAHHFADEVIHMLTGENGVASTRIIFRRKNEGMWELVMSDYDGYNPRVILRHSSPLLSPRWVDGGDGVIYTSFRYGKPDLFLRYLSESFSKAIASYDGLNYSVDWSEVRKELLATLSKDGNAEIYTMTKDGTIKRRLTHNRSIDCSPSWSPNGREFIFTSDRTGSPQIYRMEADGSNLRRLTFYGDYNESPAWSPLGNIIAFVSRIDGFFQLCTIRPDGSEFRTITDESRDHEDPRWAPNGRHLVYMEKRGDQHLISIIDITTLGKRILSEGETPDWSM
jgi:TolB protein